jgi:hypothetical protein
VRLILKMSKIINENNFLNSKYGNTIVFRVLLSVAYYCASKKLIIFLCFVLSNVGSFKRMRMNEILRSRTFTSVASKVQTHSFDQRVWRDPWFDFSDSISV